MKKKFFLLVIAASFIPLTITECNTTAVHLFQITPTGGSLNEPGNYYVGYDITGSLSIDADKVTLNLNGHTVRNITLENHQDITITNGIVDSTDAEAEVTAGISIMDCTNIRLSNVKVLYDGSMSNVIKGIHVNGGRNVFLSHILVEGFPSTGCKIEGVPQLVLISESEFSKNGFMTNPATTDDLTGLFIDHNNPGSDPTVNVIVKSCLSTGNKVDGFRVSGRSNSGKPTVWFSDCIASNNLGVGFHGKQIISTSSDNGNFVAIRCVADLNRRGFWTEANTQFYFERCIARNNITDGFRASGDTGTVGHVKNCRSLSNFLCGFNNDGTKGKDQPVAYVANFAQANGDNYCIQGDNHTKLPYCVRPAHSDEGQFWRNTEP